MPDPLSLNPDSDTIANDGAWTYAGATGGIADTTAVALKAGVAGEVQELDTLQFVNTDASVATEVEILSGSTVLWRGFAPAAGAHPTSVRFDGSIKTAAGAALNVKAVTTSAQLIVNAQGRSVAG